MYVLTEPSDGVSHMPPRAMTVPPVTVTLPSASTEPATMPLELPPLTSVKPPETVMFPFESIASVSPDGVVTSR